MFLVIVDFLVRYVIWADMSKIEVLLKKFISVKEWPTFTTSYSLIKRYDDFT